MLKKKKRIPINEEIDRLKMKIATDSPRDKDVEDIVKLNRFMREMSMQHYDLIKNM